MGLGNRGVGWHLKCLSI
ncbi:Protein of unknown function [Bacillus wiedmannii]|uniref:Uncharacterized protein n=1 Tax=Bacillus wiedmannii TaxID=1890302 RepID=A0A1C4FGI7_9BACI|nr:Protein of unknown function [Bacillus wiedmannii]